MTPPANDDSAQDRRGNHDLRTEILLLKRDIAQIGKTLQTFADLMERTIRHEERMERDRERVEQLSLQVSKMNERMAAVTADIESVRPGSKILARVGDLVVMAVVSGLLALVFKGGV